MLIPVHIQNTDIILDEGGPFEISAQELYNLLHDETIQDFLQISNYNPQEGQLLAYVGGSVNGWAPVNPSEFGGYSPADFDSDFASKSTDDLSEGGSNLYFTNERVDDRVASFLVAGSNITLIYNDVANTLTIESAGGSGGGSVGFLGDIGDVNLDGDSSPEDGDILIYTGGSLSEWTSAPFKKYPISIEYNEDGTISFVTFDTGEFLSISYNVEGFVISTTNGETTDYYQYDSEDNITGVVRV